MKTKNLITQNEVSAALQNFINKGGVIHHLPDQEYNTIPMIGEDKYQIYEAISELMAVSNIGDPS